MQRVNDSQFKEVKRQIKRCCNYDKGFCYALDGECAQKNRADKRRKYNRENYLKNKERD